MKLVDIVTSALSVFETILSKALNNGEIDEQEFQVLQELHLKVINKLSNVDCKMESETRNQLQNIYWKRTWNKENLIRVSEVSEVSERYGS